MRARLRHLFHSLKFRLAALNLLVFGLIQGASFSFIYELRSNDARMTFDQWLTADAQRMCEEVIAHSGGWDPLPELGDKPELSPFHLKGCYFQLRSPDGATLVKSSNLASREIPFGPHERSASAAPVLETVHSETLAPTPGLSGDIRVLTIYSPRGPNGPFYLQIAARLDRVTEAIAGLRTLLLLLFPVSLTAVGLGSWFLANRSLSPIQKITAAARKLTIDRLGQRLGLNVPTGDLSVLVASLNEMLERIEEGVRSQERFASDVSHELKTPISVLLGEAQVLSRKNRSLQEYQEFLSSVETEMHHLAKTVDSLLLLARANAGYPIPTVALPLNDILAESARRCQPIAERANVALLPRLMLPSDDEPELLVRGDEELLCAMLSNLLLNAIRHSPAGETVNVELSQECGEAVITVRDHGPGIPPGLLGRLFRPLASETREQGLVRGTGLGLLIVRSVVQLSGGSISARNLPEGGCEFLVRLPLASPDTFVTISKDE